MCTVHAQLIAKLPAKSCYIYGNTVLEANIPQQEMQNSRKYFSTKISQYTVMYNYGSHLILIDLQNFNPSKIFSYYGTSF